MQSRVPTVSADPDEDDLWFLPGPPADDAPPRHVTEGDVVADWHRAEAGLAARLARVTARFGALDDRLLRGPPGWRHRLALQEASELGWFAGDRIAPDRLALWLALRSGSADDTGGGLRKTAWAFRRLSGGPGPEAGLAAFLDRRDATTDPDEAPLGDRIDGWSAMLARTENLHPVTRACAAFHLWPMAGIGPEGERLEAAVTAARIAATEGRGGAVFVPLAMAGAGGLRAGGDPARRLKLWLDGMDSATSAAMRLLDRLEAWQAHAGVATADLSGRTPARLIRALVEWPLLSAPMAETLTRASRAAVQRNLSEFARRGLLQEVTGQGRFRFWRVTAIG